MNPEIKKLQDEVAQLRENLKKLENSTTIPLEVDAAFRGRLNLNSVARLSSSSKSASSENKAVNESGSSSYSVLNPPDGFLQTKLNGSTIYLAYWTS